MLSVLREEDYQQYVEENARSKEQLEELCKIVEKVPEYIAMEHTDVDPQDAVKLLPPGWNEIGRMIQKFMSMYPEVRFSIIKIYKGVLLIIPDLDKSDLFRYNFIRQFLAAMAVRSSTFCMITGEQAYRVKELPGWPCLNNTLATVYFNKLDEEERGIR